MPSSLIAGLFLVAAAAALTVVAMSAVVVDDQIIWGAIALAVFCTGLLLLMSATTGGDGFGHSDWRIGSWSLVWGALAFGLATITWIGSQAGTAAEILPASILRALWMLALAMAMLTAGYCAGPYRLAVAHARRAADAVTGQLTDDIRGPAVPWVLFGIGVTAQLGYALLTSHLGYIGDVAASVTTASGYSQYLAVAGDCVPLSVAAAAIRAYQTRVTGAWVSLAVLFAGAICAGAIIGGKTSFVVAILAVIIPRTVIRRRLSRARYWPVIWPRPSCSGRPATWPSASGPSTARRSSCSGPRRRFPIAARPTWSSPRWSTSSPGSCGPASPSWPRDTR